MMGQGRPANLGFIMNRIATCSKKEPPLIKRSIPRFPIKYNYRVPLKSIINSSRNPARFPPSLQFKCFPI